MMRFQKIALLIILTIVPGLVKAQAEPVELSLSTMILFAMDNNPDLLMAQDREAQMDYFVKEAYADYYPQVDVELAAGREFLSPTTGQNPTNLGKATLNVNQKLFDGFVTGSEIDRRKELQNSAAYDTEKEKEDLIIQITDYYLDILRYQNVVATTEIFVAEIDEIVGIIQTMFESGATGKAMLDYAKSRQASAYVDLNEARSSLNDGVSNLEFLTGKLPPFKAVLPDSFDPSNLDRHVYIDKMSAENTLMQKSTSEIEAMRHQLQGEKGQYFPKVDLRLKAEESHDDGGDVGRFRNLKGTVNLSYNIFDGFNKRNRVGRVSRQLTELEHREEKIFKELKKDINLAYNQIAAMKESIKVVNLEIKSNRALQMLNRENFRLGSINVIELIEGEERLNAAYNKKYQLQRDLYESIYTLLITTAIIEDEYFCETCDLTVEQ